MGMGTRRKKHEEISCRFIKFISMHITHKMKILKVNISILEFANLSLQIKDLYVKLLCIDQFT
jgi:hypothetical protein